MLLLQGNGQLKATADNRQNGIESLITDFFASKEGFLESQGCSCFILMALSLILYNFLF